MYSDTAKKYCDIRFFLISSILFSIPLLCPVIMRLGPYLACHAADSDSYAFTALTVLGLTNNESVDQSLVALFKMNYK